MCKILAVLASLPLFAVATQWQSLNGPPAGRADDLSMGWDPIHSYYAIYAADQTHKLYKSTNEGEYWDSIAVAAHPYVTNPTCVITDPNNAQIVYIGKNPSTPDDHCVWKSEDGGLSWNYRDYNITNTHPRCFAMDPNNSSVVYLGCGTGVCAMFKTTNSGETWTEKPFPTSPANPNVNDLAITADPIVGTKILAGCTGGIEQRGVWCSIDGGENWSRILDESIFSVEFAGMDIIYAGTDHGVYKSMDGGLYWIYLPNSPQTSINDLEAITATMVYAATNDTMYKTTDGGGSWNRINVNYRCDIALRVRVHPTNDLVLFSTGEWCIYKTTSGGGEWCEITKGYRPSNLVNITTNRPSIYGCGHPIAVGKASLFRSTNSGNNWITLDGSFSTEYGDFWADVISVSPAFSNIVLFGGHGENIESEWRAAVVRSSDQGATWQDVFLASPSEGSTRAIEFCPNQVNTVFAGFKAPQRLIRSTDTGVNWVEKTIADVVFSLGINSRSDNIIYAGTQVNGVYKSTNTGDNWTETALDDKTTNALAIDFDYPDTIYAGSKEPNGIYKTTDGFANYLQVNNGLDYLYIKDLEIDPSEPTIVYALCKPNAAATQSYVYCTVDRGGKWFNLTSGLPSGKLTYDLEIDRDIPDPVYAATDVGVYTYTPDFNKSLVSSSPEATAANQAKHMLCGMSDIWITYESGGVIYAVHSSDAGITWSKKMEIGNGYCPAIASKPELDPPAPGIVWWAKGVRDTLYFSRYVSDYTWTAPVPIVTTNYDYSPPSFVIGDDNIGRLVYSVRAIDDRINYTQFNINNPVPVTDLIYFTGINPSIGYMPPNANNPEIHLAWEQSGNILYRSRTVGGTWSGQETVFSSGCAHPSIAVDGAAVYFVSKRSSTASYCYALYTQNGNHGWSRRHDFATGYPLDYPVLTGGNAMSCVADLSHGNTEIYFYNNPGLSWLGPVNISNSVQRSFYPHIVLRQTVAGTVVHFAWTENDNPAYDIQFATQSIGGYDSGEDLAFYAATAGDSLASPFNLKRAGFLHYGQKPYQHVDYDNQYLEYAFSCLDPAKDYALTAYFYQQGYSNLSLSMKIDNILIKGISLLPDTLITYKAMLPYSFYADSMVNIKIFGNNAVSSAFVLHQYEKSGGEGGGPQGMDNASMRPDRLMLNVLSNPVRRELRITYAIPDAATINISLYDVTGRLAGVLSDKFHDAGFYRHSLGTGGLTPGIYFLRLSTGDKAVVEKTIILR